MAYTTTDLLAAIKRRAQLPAANGALSDADLLDLATLAMRVQIQPLLRSLREDYSVITETQAITADQRTYRIPSRAEGGAVRDVWLTRVERAEQAILDAEQLIASPNTEIRVPYIPPEDRPMYKAVRGAWWDGLLAYTVEGNDLWLAPIPDSVAAQYMLTIRYYLRPGRFVTVAECDSITSASTAGYLVSAGSVFTGGSAPAAIDVIGASPPFRPRVIGSAYTVSGVGDVDVDFDTPSAVIEAPASGDYACATDTTCVVTCPVEAQEALVAATVASVYDVLGYERELGTAVALRDQALQAVRVLMEPRTEGASRVLLDPRSPLRRGRRSVW